MDKRQLADHISSLSISLADEAKKAKSGEDRRNLLGAASALSYIASVAVRGESLSMARFMEDHPLIKDEFDNELDPSLLNHRLDLLAKEFDHPEAKIEGGKNKAEIFAALSVINLLQAALLGGETLMFATALQVHFKEVERAKAGVMQPADPRIPPS